MDLNELQIKQKEIKSRIEAATFKRSEAECSIPKLEAELKTAEIKARRRGSGLAEQEAVHGIGLKLEAAKESVLQLSADLEDLKDDLEVIECEIVEIESDKRQEKRKAIIKANRRTFDDYNDVRIRLAESQIKDDALRQQFNTAFTKYNDVRMLGSAGFNNSINDYDKACATLYAEVDKLERQRDEHRGKMIPLEHQAEELREVTEKLLAKI